MMDEISHHEGPSIKTQTTSAYINFHFKKCNNALYCISKLLCIVMSFLLHTYTQHLPTKYNVVLRQTYFWHQFEVKIL